MKGVKIEMEADRRLIALVRKFPALYDAEDAQYQDSAWKNAAWRKIGAELGMDARLCRSRWFNMRDIYRKSLIRNHMKRRLGQSMRVYKYARDMAFLTQYFNNLTPPDADPLSEESAHGGVDDENSEPFPEAPQEAEPPTLAKMERCDSAEPFLALDVSDRPPSHPVDAFLACIEPTLKALPPYLLSLAKGEIFASVQKYELRMLGAPGEGNFIAAAAKDELANK